MHNLIREKRSLCLSVCHLETQVDGHTHIELTAMRSVKYYARRSQAK